MGQLNDAHKTRARQSTHDSEDFEYCSFGGRFHSKSASMSVLLALWQNATSLLMKPEKKHEDTSSSKPYLVPAGSLPYRPVNVTWARDGLASCPSMPMTLASGKALWKSPNNNHPP